MALGDLEEAFAFISESSPDAAIAGARRVWDFLPQLVIMPGMGRPGRVPGTRELVVLGTPFVVPYRVRDGVVEILRVLHSSREWPDKF